MARNESTERDGATEPTLIENRFSRIVAKRIEIARIQKIVDERTLSLKSAKAVLDDANRQLLTEIDDDLRFDDTELWKSVRTAALGIPAVLVDAMHEVDVDTIGDIDMFCESNSLENMKGIGPKGSATICAILDRYRPLLGTAPKDS